MDRCYANRGADRGKGTTGKSGLRATGQGIVEYALILVLIAIVVIIILTLLGGQVNNVFSIMTSAL